MRKKLLQTFADVVAVRYQVPVLFFARYDTLLAENVRTLIASELDCICNVLTVITRLQSHSTTISARYDLSTLVEWKEGFLSNYTVKSIKACQTVVFGSLVC